MLALPHQPQDGCWVRLPGRIRPSGLNAILRIIRGLGIGVDPREVRLQKGPVASGTSGGQERDKRGNKKRTRGKLHVQLSW